MVSPYQSIISYEGNDWNKYLEDICLIDVFGDLLKEFPDVGDFKSIIKYILFSYSVESNMVSIGGDWAKTKKKIFEKCCIKPTWEFYNSLVHLQNTKIQEAIQKWLEYQDEDTYTQLSILKDLRSEMQMSCLTPIKKASGEIDYTQKFLNSEYSVKLKETIKDLESELIQNSNVLKDSVKEFREAKRNIKTFGVETFLKEEK